MSTWSTIAKFKGNRTSPEFTLNLDGDGTLSRISWDSDILVSSTPISSTPIGATPIGVNKLTIETSLSFDGGLNWTDWKVATNGGTILDADTNVSLKNSRIKYRVTEETNDKNTTPLLRSVSFYFEPIINFNNGGDTKIRPEIWITKVGNGDISIINTSNGDQEFKFTGLLDGETVYINGDREYIETDLALTYRYSNFNDNYLELLYNSNVLKVIGNAKIQFRYQYKYLQG